MAKETIDFINEEEFVDIFVEDEDNQIDVFIEDDIISNDITIEDDTESADITVDDTESETNLVVEADEVEDISAELFDDFLKGDKGEKGEAGITDYEKLENLPEINETKIKGKLTTEDLGIVGTSMTEIELSTDIANPTEILNFINKSGTYVAKNLGVIGTNGEAVTALAKGQFFTVSNLQEYAKSFGLEIPDDENIIDIDARTPDGIHITYRIIGGRQVQEIVWINSKNINDYVDVTSKISQALRSAINYSYGMQMVGNYVSFVSASNYEIDNANNQYRVITPTNIKYAIQKWGAEYYAAKEKQEALENDLSTLKTEIETILESVVTIDE